MSWAEDGARGGMSRAWVEVDLGNLSHNLRVLCGQLPAGCEPMPVLKANAYGHGDVRVARCLEDMGVRTLAVATADEGAALRRAGIGADILVLGYTMPCRAAELAKLNLIQTLVDLPYAMELSAQGVPLRTHVKIDTGMRRIGQDSGDTGALAQMYRLPNLAAEGSYSHLATAAAADGEELRFARLQADLFFGAVRRLRAEGIDTGALHLQNSYGAVTLGGLPCDYARLGILLYGALVAARDRVPLYARLRPVAAVRARVVQVNTVRAGETVGYDRTFTAPCDMPVAVLACGYADGIPRALSCGAGQVLLHGARAAVAGRVCMDMLMVDARGAPHTRQGDIATLIGRCGDGEIRAEEMAAAAGTNAHEILSRLSPRLARVYIDGNS